jgi:hypothetical protein
MHHGHDPRDVDQYAWRDVEAYLTVLPDLLALESPFSE